MNRTRRVRPAARGRDVMELLASARPASLDPSAGSRPRLGETAAVAATTSSDSRRSLPLRPRHPVRRLALSAGVAVTAALAAVALVLAVAPAAPPHVARPRASSAPPIRLTARAVLLIAASHVASAPVTGVYWRTREISGELLPAGTKDHPYDMFLPISYDQWAPRSAGRREWSIHQTKGVVPATPADAAAWQAAGSPTRWTYGLGTVTTAAGPPGATWQPSDGTVGFVEGNEPGLTAAQFGAMPATPAGLLTRLRHYALLTWCAQHPGGGCETVDQLVAGEAESLLQDPVTSQVRAAAYRVLAALPGVRLLGQMKDPLGRVGYGLGAGGNGGGIAVIDPQTGVLLATEALGSASSTACQGTAVVTGQVAKSCDGFLYYGRSYPGQVSGYEVTVSAGWTNATPVLPPRATWLGPDGQSG